MKIRLYTEKSSDEIELKDFAWFKDKWRSGSRIIINGADRSCGFDLSKYKAFEVIQ